MADDGQTFPAGNAATEKDRYKPDQFPVPSANNNKEAERSGAGAGADGKCGLGSGLKSTLVISSVVAAAVGVALFVTKKLKQT